MRENATPLREAVGIFFGAEPLRAAIEDLLASGFDRSELGLLAGEFTVKQKLGDIYAELNENADDPSAPGIRFILKDAGTDTVHSIFGGLSLAGITAAGGAVVASAAVLGGALAPAVAGVAAVVGIGAVFSRILHQSDAEHLEEEIEKGNILLLVRTRDAAQEKKAGDILKKHSAYDVHICTIPATKP
jgi:hypothetical protein